MQTNLPCLNSYTKPFKSFCDLLYQRHASIKHENGIDYMVYYEINGLAGKELEEYTIENNIVHPIFMEDGDQRKYIKSEPIDIPYKICFCCD